MARKALKVIACAAVIEEMLPELPPDVAREALDFGLHVKPSDLKRHLQEAIDRSAAEAEVVVLGYGLCAQAVIGLHGNGCTLVLPKVDDCISIFFGSQRRRLEVARSDPGTYYLTKGWIEAGDSPFSEYERAVERLGQERADRAYRQILKHYTRLVLINTGQDLQPSSDYCRRAAERFGLRFEEILGSTELVRKMVFGPWDEEFLVIPPGGTVSHEAFYPQ